MSDLNKIQSARQLYSQGYLSVRDIINISANQLIYKIADKYFWLRDSLYGDWRCVWNYKRDLPAGDKKRALVSFLRIPLYKRHFVGRIKFFFSTNGLMLGWVKVLNRLGYICDVIDLSYQDFRVKKNYDVVIYHGGQNFRALSKLLPQSIKKISFETGAHWQTHNAKEQERFDSLQERKNITLPLDRKVRNEEQAEEVFQKADAIVVLGGQFTAQTYSRFPKVYNLPNGFYADKYFERKAKNNPKNFETAKKNFLFYSGGGNIHKGLDLAIEAFAKTNLHLYICTYLEAAVADLYKNELALPNIHVVGYIPQRSKGFYDLVEKCAFNLHPSCCEGSPGGVIDLLQYGIIPIISKESGLDLGEPAVTLKENTIEEIGRVITDLSQRDNQILETNSKRIRQMAFDNFSKKKYEENLTAILKKIL